MAGLRILGVLAVAALTALAATAPAQALIGTTPTVKLVDADTVQISGFRANRGLVQAADSDRFVMRVEVITGGECPVVDYPLLAEKDTDLRRGADVELAPVAYDVAVGLKVGDKVGLRVSLVLKDAAGGTHVLDSLSFAELTVSS